METGLIIDAILTVLVVILWARTVLAIACQGENVLIVVEKLSSSRN
jgi:hypothetical protein